MEGGRKRGRIKEGRERINHFASVLGR
jgi:hypothetical protein